MASTGIKVGILAPSAEMREMLRLQVSTTGMGLVEVESDQYCLVATDRPARRLLEASPDIIIVDLEDAKAALQSLRVLHSALPETWLFACSGASDPQFIIETMRAGAREFLAKPVVPRDLSQALSRYATEKQQRQKRSGHIYCVTSAKGGVGATSLAINLAASIAAAPRMRVALIDLGNPLGDTAAQLNLKPQFTVDDALRAASRLDPVLLESFMSHAHGISVLPGSKEFTPGEPGSPDALAKLLEVTAHTYTHAFIDLASSLDQEHLKVATDGATGIVVISTTEVPTLWRTERLLRYLSTSGQGEKLRLVMNRWKRSDDVTDAELERALKHPMYWKLPNNYQGSVRAINSGSPLVSANHSELAHSYRDLAYQLTGLPLQEKKRGLFGLFS